MTNETGYLDYLDAVRALAVDVVKAVRAGADPHDALHECVDSSYWVIYTHAALATLTHSQNDNAVFDLDGLEGCNSMAEVYTRAAYWALRVDVAEELRSMGFDTNDTDSFVS